MKRAKALLLLALVGACDDDGPAGPKPVTDVDILLNSVPLEQESLRVGESVQLAAELRDDDGRLSTDRRATWRSTAPSVASVDTTGLVTGVGAGEALIIASADLAADTVRFTVLAPTTLPAEIACAPGAQGLALQVGEVTTITAQQQPVICLSGGTGAEYTLIPFHAAASPSRLAVEVTATGVVPAQGPPNPALLPSSARARLSLAGSAAAPQLPLDRGVDRRLREWERRNFPALRSSLLRGGTEPGFSRSAAARPVPAVGDTIRLNVNADQACSDPIYRLARVEAVTEHAIVVADTANPRGGFTRDEYRAFGVTFDTLVWRVDTENFGTPQDLDRNEKIMIFFTGAVNQLSEPNSGSVVGGFFFGRDLFERAGTGTQCPGSNQGELFYMLVPDPEGLINQNRRTKQYVAGTTVAVLAHEFQHLINFSRRLFVNNAAENEKTWLNEGLSHIAEELVFYEAANLLPESNLGIEELRGTAGVFAKFVEYQWANFGRYTEYLENPADASALADDDDLSTRGATWAFLRYAADRKTTGGVQRQIWFDLVNSRTSGVQNLQNVFGVNPVDWLEDWTVSVYTDDTLLMVAERYQQPSWNFRSILGPGGVRSASTGQPIFPTFPLQTLALRSGVDNQRTFSLQGGGAAFLRFGVPAGERGAVRVSSGGQVAPARLRVMIVRTR